MVAELQDKLGALSWQESCHMDRAQCEQPVESEQQMERRLEWGNK